MTRHEYFSPSQRKDSMKFFRFVYWYSNQPSHGNGLRIQQTKIIQLQDHHTVFVLR